MHVVIHAYIHVCIVSNLKIYKASVCMHVCNVYICLYVCMYTYARMHTCMFVCLQVRI